MIFQVLNNARNCGATMHRTSKCQCINTLCILCFKLRSHKKGTSRGGGYTLNLSTHNLTEKTCAILGRALATDRTFCEIKLNDCMLPEERECFLCLISIFRDSF